MINIQIAFKLYKIIVNTPWFRHYKIEIIYKEVHVSFPCIIINVDTYKSFYHSNMSLFQDVICSCVMYNFCSRV